jgi:hypothetical protein
VVLEFKTAHFPATQNLGNSKVEVGTDAVSTICLFCTIMNAQSEVRDNPYVAVVAKKHRNLKKK